jgi:uncharacterized protein YecT (DUF1311 family)
VTTYKQFALVASTSLLLLLSACGGGASNATLGKADEKKVDSAQQDCVSRQVIDLLRDKIFDTAITTSKAEKKAAQNLNNLRAALAGRIENPVLQGHDAQIRKTSCAGRLVFGLPPSVMKAFGGTSSLFADISYTVQQAADKSGLVVEATGIDSVVQTLIDASQHKRIVKVEIPAPSVPSFAPSSAAPRLPTDIAGVFDPPPSAANRDYGDLVDAPPSARPSFGCKGKLTRVEKMICADSMLADQDRALDSAFKDARNRTTDANRGPLLALQSKYRARRDACQDAACVSATYDAWTSDVYAFQPE